MSKSKLALGLTVILGGLGAALRMWHRASGYDEAGLPVAGAPAALVLTLFLILCVLAAVLFTLRQPVSLSDQSAAAPRGALAGVLLAAAAVLLLAGGLLELKRFADGYLEVSQAIYFSAKEESTAVRVFFLSKALSLVMSLAAIPAAAALLYQAKRAKTESEAAYNSLAALMPSLFAWLWLIETYRRHTSNPILWDYVLLLLAAVALLLSAYFRAGFRFGLGKPWPSLALSLPALFFALSALPDTGDLSTAVILIALTLHAAVELCALLTCFNYQPRRLAVQSPNRSDQQEGSPHEQ